MTSKEDLVEYYKTTTLLVHTKEFSLSEINDMIPFELDIRIDMINELIEKSKKQQREI